MCNGPTKATATKLSSGVIVPTLAPFDQNGMVLLDATTDQTRRIAKIPGVIGIAVNKTDHERQMLSLNERIEIIRRTRTGLGENQLLLTGAGDMSATCPSSYKMGI